jgi:hypothetical protein
MATSNTYPTSGFTSLIAPYVDTGYLFEELNTNAVDVKMVLNNTTHYTITLNTDLVDWSVVDTVVAAHTGEKPETLDELKSRRIKEINDKTDYLVHTGYVTLNGINFSTAFVSQFNITALKDHTASFTFPKDITTYEQDTYQIEEADVDTLWVLMKDNVDAKLDAGRVLKKSIIDAADKAAVDAVVDNR